MKILLIEAFYGGSHQQWADALQQFSQHEIQLLTLSDHHWKWRMHGGAVTLAKRYMEMNFEAELVLATDMLDLTTFLALTRPKTAQAKVAFYFHENQLTYPWSPQDRDVEHKRKHHYAFINYSSALAADICLFNSQYHLDSFCGALPGFLKMFPAPNNAYTIDLIRAKSQVLPLGMDLQRFDAHRVEEWPHQRLVILWNHRWEYDKNPEGFFEALFTLQDRGIDFRLIVLGKRNSMYPEVFDVAKERLADKILYWGYAEKFEDYARWLWQADILPVTSHQDFFGMSIVEAVYCNVKPLLPKRLAYPEHFPQAYLQSSFFYEEGDLVTRLQGMLFHPGILRKQKTQQYVTQYDWQECIVQYDKALILNS